MVDMFKAKDVVINIILRKMVYNITFVNLSEIGILTVVLSLYWRLISDWLLLTLHYIIK